MKLFMVLLLVSGLTFAEDMIPKNEEVNHCLDPQAAKDNESMVRRHSTDKSLVRLVAIRIGLCDLVDKKIITIKLATHIFEAEQVKSIADRLREEIENSTETLL